MLYSVFPHETDTGVWVAGAVNHVSEGEVYTATFAGFDAERLAREYADWKNSQPATCPVCGSSCVDVQNRSRSGVTDGYGVYCRSCFGDCRPEVKGPVADTTEDAIAAWNEMARTRKDTP